MAELQNSPLFTDANLVAYYKLSNVSDSKGSYTLTNVGTATFGSAKFDDGLLLGTANSSKYLRVSSAMGISNGAVSISMWVKINTAPATNGTNRLFVRTETTTDVRHWISYNDTSGTPYLQFNRQRENVANDSFNYNVNLGTTAWHHIVLTYDGTNVKGYLDGAYLNAVASSGNGLSGVYADSTTIGVGETNQDNSNPSNYSSADIDDVAIFNRALTAVEVEGLYSGGMPRMIQVID